MFETLITLDPADFVDEAEVPARDMLDAKYNTAQLLESLGVASDETIIKHAEQESARTAFLQMTLSTSEAQKREAVLAVHAPKAVQHLVAMLTAYDWQFVEQAQELRGYAVAQILEETKSEDKRHRLRALELLGKITEVALFSERIEIKKSDITDEELEKKIREKLGRIIPAEYTTENQGEKA